VDECKALPVTITFTSSCRSNSRPTTRGLHSFPFQLNLSSSVHRITQLNS